MSGAPDTLQEARDRMRRTQLAYEVNFADIDAELERGGRHHRLQRAVLETPFGVKPLLFGEAAVMRSHAVFAEAVRKFARTRSTMRRVFTKISVVRWSSMSSAKRS